MTAYAWAGAIIATVGGMIALFFTIRKDQKSSALAKVVSDQAEENRKKLERLNESNLAIDKQTDNAIDRLGVRPPD